MIKHTQKGGINNGRTPPLTPGTLSPPHIKLSELKCLNASSQAM